MRLDERDTAFFIRLHIALTLHAKRAETMPCDLSQHVTSCDYFERYLPMLQHGSVTPLDDTSQEPFIAVIRDLVDRVITSTACPFT